MIFHDIIEGAYFFLRMHNIMGALKAMENL